MATDVLLGALSQTIADDTIPHFQDLELKNDITLYGGCWTGTASVQGLSYTTIMKFREDSTGTMLYSFLGNEIAEEFSYEIKGKMIVFSEPIIEGSSSTMRLNVNEGPHLLIIGNPKVGSGFKLRRGIPKEYKERFECDMYFG